MVAVTIEAARLGDAISTGHGCDSSSTILGALQTSVRTNGIINAVKGDAIAPHTILGAGVGCVLHPAVVNVGSSTVFIEGIPAARYTDSADLGQIEAGSPNVFIGG